jgi:hypothetical protein
MRWWDALKACDILDFGGHNDWRLPTQKEMQQAAIHGIRSLEGSNFIAELDTRFWSATTDSDNFTKAWYVTVGHGTTFGEDKTVLLHFICVK